MFLIEKILDEIEALIEITEEKQEEDNPIWLEQYWKGYKQACFDIRKDISAKNWAKMA